METEVLQKLNDDHKHIATVLDALEQELRDSDDHDTDWLIVNDLVSWLQEYPDAVHHPLEDQMFDRVLDKGLTPAERELVHFNLAQHAEITAATHKLATDVDSILNDIVVPLNQLNEHFERYVETQRIHMRNENTNLFPLAQRLLSEADWAEVGAEAALHRDPMFELKLEKYTDLYNYVTGQ